MARQADDRLTTARRRAFVLERRRAGRSYREIADDARRKFGEDNLPSGWDERYAYKDLKRELDKIEKANRQSALAILHLEALRLDALMNALWKKAMSGDVEAVHGILRAMRHRERLFRLSDVAVEAREEPSESSAQKIADAIREVSETYDLSAYDEELEDL